MHIEINAGGLGSGIAIAEYQLNMSSFISDAESVISSFKAVQNKAYDLNGGIGALQGAADDLASRIQVEEEKREAAITVQNKSNDFLDLATRVDKQVASLVNRNKDEFYRTNPWLKPTISADETIWYEDAWNWLCDTKDAVVAGAKEMWAGIKDTVKKAWDGLVVFYNEHKKIIDTILIVVGTIGVIAAVIATGGLALVPLLGALGLSASAAVAISTAVAVIAVVSTVASSTLNVVDTWAEIDNTTFNAWQTGFNITAAVSNLTYSIGNIYNSIKGVTPREYLASHSANNQPTNLMFDDSVPISQDTLSDERYFARGEHYDEFSDFWENGGGDYKYTKVDNPQTTYVKASEIEGVYLNKSEVTNPSGFWNKRYSKNEYMDYVSKGSMNGNPVEVTKVSDSFYYFEGDGRHRILVAKELDIDIPVIIKGIYQK